MLIPDGEYDFQVMKAEEGVSKTSGNDMITLQIGVFLPDGTTRTVKDWLVGSDAPMCAMKIRHFARSCDLMSLYEAGAIDQYACEGACGRVKIGSQDSAQYGPQNNVVDYIAAGEPQQPVAPSMPTGPSAQQTRAANEALAAAAGNDEECPF